MDFVAGVPKLMGQLGQELDLGVVVRLDHLRDLNKVADDDELIWV